MTTISALGAVLLLTASCLGLGAAILRALGLLGDRPRGERFAWSFAVGFGALGWLVFFAAAAGRIGPTDLFVLCAVGASGTVFLRGAAGGAHTEAVLDGAGRALCALIALVLLFDLFEGLSPPADADTLSYHFALPKQFLAAGTLEFVPRAGTGAAPLLVQMTYLPALGLGGERALTLWATATGWMTAALLFTVCRRHLALNWSLAVTLLFLTTPAVLFGAGSGQVETRLAMFAIVACIAAAESVADARLGHAALAGAMAGFYAGGKYMGLLFAAACGCAMLIGAGRLKRCLVFAAATAVVGGQWYGWNLYHTGDPVFPVLFRLLDLPDSEIWTRSFDTLYRAHYFGAENPLPVGPLTLLSYPFIAAFGIEPRIESGRTGFGPFLLLVLPFAAAGAYRFRRRILTSRLAVPVLIVALFYVLWIFSGTSQRIRHLLPIYPVALLAFTVAAVRWASWPAALRPLVAATVIAIGVQVAGHGLFASSYVRHVLTGEGRIAFFKRTVDRYAAVKWINANLGPSDRVLFTQTQHVYLLDVPGYFAHPLAQAVIDVSTRANDLRRFLAQLRARGITHILLTNNVDPETGAIDPVHPMSNLPQLVTELREHGCARMLEPIAMHRTFSRTIDPLLDSARQAHGAVFALTPGTCRP